MALSTAQSISSLSYCGFLLLIVLCNISTVPLAALDQFEDRLERRILLRESMFKALNLPFISCRPDAFPGLRIQGMCSSIDTLDLMCGDLEISQSSWCTALDGQLCCYSQYKLTVTVSGFIFPELVNIISIPIFFLCVLIMISVTTDILIDHSIAVSREQFGYFDKYHAQNLNSRFYRLHFNARTEHQSIYTINWTIYHCL